MSAPDARPRGRPPLTGEQRHRVRLEISRAAVVLFREQGVAATSGDQIARACGLSARSLWRHVRSKEACVEPLLTQSVGAFTAALATWPADRSLEAHLAEHFRLPEEASEADVAAVFDIVAMTRGEPGLRAVWLLLHQRAEPALAVAVAARVGLATDSLEVRVQAATLNAAVRVAAEEMAAELAGEASGGSAARRGPVRGTTAAYRAVLERAVGVAGRGLIG